METKAGPRREQGSMFVESHMRCTACDYDLFGVVATEKCPECGIAVQEVVAEHRWRRRGELPLLECDPAWVRHMARGITLILIAAAFAVVAGWVGFVWNVEHFWFGIWAIPPWVIAAAGVWRLTSREPGRPFRPRVWERWLVRVTVIFFVFLPVFMIRPGYLSVSDHVVSATWSPVWQEALRIGILSPLGTGFVLAWCAGLAKRCRRSGLVGQAFLLAILSTGAMLFTTYMFYESSYRMYSPLCLNYDLGGAAGVGHAGLFMPFLVYMREATGGLMVLETGLSVWGLVVLALLRAELLRTAARAEAGDVPDVASSPDPAAVAAAAARLEKWARS